MVRESDAHDQFASGTRHHRGRHRARRRVPYEWLGAGALALGLGTAMAGGTGVAHADAGGNQTSSAGQSGHSGRPAPSVRHGSASGPTRRAAVTTSRTDRAPVTVDNSVTEASGRISLGRREPGPSTPPAPGGPLFAAVLGAVREVELAVHRRVAFGPVTTTSLVEHGMSSTSATAVARTATAGAADAASPTEAEREQSVAELNMSVGWIPGVGTVLNGLSLVSDFLDFTIAALRGDTADMGDEVADMTVDVIGMIPIVGAPLAGTIARLRVPDPAPGDHAPSPGTDNFTTDEDTPLLDNVLSNDTDADGDILTATLKKAPAHGVVSLAADGSFTYTPTADYNGADVFTYTVSDGPKSKTGTVKITVNAVNDAPVAGDDAATLDEDTSAVIAVLSNDTDADRDPLSVVEATAPGHGSISLGVNGAITYTPTANYNGSDSFDYTVSDGHGGTATATLHLTINPVSDVAVDVTTDPATGVATGTAVSTDPEAGPLTYSGSTTTAKGTVVVAADGSFTYTPTATARHESARVGAGSAQTTDTFTITATDTAGATTIAVSVEIAPANSAPVIGTATAGTPNTSTGVVTGTVTATDPDGDVLMYSTPRSTALGSVVINAGTGVFTYTPTDAARRAATASTTDSFTVTVDDGYGGVSTTTVTVSVAPVDSGGGTGGTAPGPYTATRAFGPFTMGQSNSFQDSLAVGPDGQVYVVANGGLTVIDPSDGSKKVFANPNYASVAVAPDGRIFVLDNSDGSVDVISADHKSIRHVKIGANWSANIEMGPDGRAYVLGSTGITVINRNLTTGTISLGGNAVRKIAVGADGYIWGYSTDTNFFSPTYGESVVLINPTSHATSTVYLGYDRDSTDIDVGPDGRAYVTDPQTGTVTVVHHDGNTLGVDETIDVGYGGAAAFTRYGDLVVNSGDGLTVVSPGTGGAAATVRTVDIGASPSDLAVGPDGRIYVTSTQSWDDTSVIEVGFRQAGDPEAHFARTDAARLYNNLRDRTDITADADGIIIDKVVGRDNQTRLIVYIGGTIPSSSGNQPVIDNVYGLNGWLKENQTTVIQQALDANPGAEIMLVGYSQGGMDAQVIAAKTGFPVTTLITYGSPIVQPPVAGVHTVHFADADDPVVNFGNGFHPDYAQANVDAGYVLTLSAGTENSPLDPLNVHTNRQTYTQIGNAFSQYRFDPTSNFGKVQADLQRFEGVVTYTYGADQSAVATSV
ncbi:Ig-like domain-containing protein [Mycolicibacterium vinylchloridicum]|uniref:Ig-like domain-containing protein n=1 Tax=Mycolicibacterium vinylchloridicum TaxID=2736928 RepID=UPI0015C941BE|nr:Ig-like domain-containing protein [Mycolicibacterium vinylchloridicum]